MSSSEWARVVAEPTVETIDHALQQTVRVPIEPGRHMLFDGEKLVLRLSIEQTAAIHMLVRQAIATELLKLEHNYDSRGGGMVAPANVAYHIAEVRNQISSWTPQWTVVTKNPDGTEEEQPFDVLDAAILDAAVELPGLTKVVRIR